MSWRRNSQECRCTAVLQSNVRVGRSRHGTSRSLSLTTTIMQTLAAAGCFWKGCLPAWRCQYSIWDSSWSHKRYVHPRMHVILCYKQKCMLCVCRGLLCMSMQLRGCRGAKTPIKGAPQPRKGHSTLRWQSLPPGASVYLYSMM